MENFIQTLNPRPKIREIHGNSRTKSIRSARSVRESPNLRLPDLATFMHMAGIGITWQGSPARSGHIHAHGRDRHQIWPNSHIWPEPPARSGQAALLSKEALSSRRLAQTVQVPVRSISLFGSSRAWVIAFARGSARLWWTRQRDARFKTPQSASTSPRSAKPRASSPRPRTPHSILTARAR